MSVPFSQLSSAAIGVWGAGREITAFADQLVRHAPSAHIRVAAFDSPPTGDVATLLRAPDVLIASGDDVLPKLLQCDVVVRSPGVSLHRPEIQALLRSGVRVVTTTGLWLADRGGRGVIAVTGTKGKSTTASLVAHLARSTGLKVDLVGNIGLPAVSLLDQPCADLVVVELSSFQIADLTLSPEIVTLTNLSPEHLDWHGSHAAYRKDKLRIFGLPGIKAAVVRDVDLGLIGNLRRGSKTLLYGVPTGWHVEPKGIAQASRFAASFSDSPLIGQHNAMNVCAALTALQAFGVTIPALPRALASFRPLPHRLETVSEIAEIRWVNDSISTNPASTIAALAAFAQEDVILVGGGQNRGQDFEELGQELAARDAKVVGLPPAGAQLIAAARRAGLAASQATMAVDLEQAVQLAREMAQAGTVVLLSPAAPSFNAYRNFEDRGEHFRRLVAAL